MVTPHPAHLVTLTPVIATSSKLYRFLTTGRIWSQVVTPGHMTHTLCHTRPHNSHLVTSQLITLGNTWNTCSQEIDCNIRVWSHPVEPHLVTPDHVALTCDGYPSDHSQVATSKPCAALRDLPIIFCRVLSYLHYLRFTPGHTCWRTSS